MNSVQSLSSKLLPFSFDMPAFDPSHAKRPSAFVGIPENFLLLIGHVVAGWSQFDISFNKLLKNFLIATSQEAEPFAVKSFPERSKQLQKLCKQYFSDNKSLLVAVTQIITDAKRLQEDRNLITHGRILIKMQTHGTVVDDQLQGTLALRCEGVIKGKIVQREYILSGLEELRYELAHLCGRINALLEAENLDHFQLVDGDKKAWQSFIEKTKPVLE